MHKPKILWLGDAVAKTGFSRVTHSVLQRLEDRYDIAVLAVNYWGDPCPEQHRWRMYPANAESHTDVYGYGRLAKIIRQEKPDVIVGLADVQINSMWAQISRPFREMQRIPYVGYMPIDGPGMYDKHFRGLAEMDVVATYSPTAALIIEQATHQRVKVIPHGSDSAVFRPLGDKAEWKTRIKASPDDFIVFNGNRNQPRKRIDITIKAFARFAVRRENAKLYLHMARRDAGWDVVDLFNREMRRNGLDPDGRLYMTSLDLEPDKNTITVEKLNEIYNACDVGINTCSGGGWELVNFEHAATRTPQIVPRIHPFLDQYGVGRDYCYAEVNSWATDPDCGIERANVDVDSVVRQLAWLYEDKEFYDHCATRAYEATQKPEYSWNAIADCFDAIIREAIDAKRKGATDGVRDDADGNPAEEQRTTAAPAA